MCHSVFTPCVYAHGVLNRRRFIQASGGLLTLPSFLEARALADASKFYVAIIADTHIIDEFYRGPESNPEDTESMFKARERLIAARDTINALQPAMEQVFLVGDYFHDYPSTDLDFYFQHTTRIDHAKELTSAFHAPVHVGFGNHDYAVPKVSREARRSSTGSKPNSPSASRRSSSSTSLSASSPPRSGPITACCRCSSSTRTRCSA